jgi:hypothetical protein
MSKKEYLVKKDMSSFKDEQDDNTALKEMD